MTSGTERRLVVANPSDGCQILLNHADEVKGNFVLVDRGTCTMAEKVRRVQAAGGGIAVIVNNEIGIQHIPAQFGEGRNHGVYNVIVVSHLLLLTCLCL